MRKLITILALFAIVAVAPVFAQNNDKDDMYYINVPIEKIYTIRDAYVIVYRTRGNILNTVAIPVDWLSNAGGNLEKIRLHPGPDWPSMSIFYRNGEFSHVRLYVHRVRSHASYGSLPIGFDASAFMLDKDSFTFRF